MIAVASAWGVFWLLMWFFLAGCLMIAGDGSKEEKRLGAASLLGIATSIAWLVAVAVAAVLS